MIILFLAITANSCRKIFFKSNNKPFEFKDLEEYTDEEIEGNSLDKVTKKRRISPLLEEGDSNKKVIDEILKGEDASYKLEELEISSDNIKYVMCKALFDLNDSVSFTLLPKLIELYQRKVDRSKDRIFCDILLGILETSQLGDSKKLEKIIISFIEKMKLEDIMNLCKSAVNYEFLNLFKLVINKRRFYSIRKKFLELGYLESIEKGKAEVLSVILETEHRQLLLKMLFNNRKNGLIISVKQDHINIAKVLLDFGIKINHRDKSGKTALIYAIASKNRDMTAFLLTKGADVNARVGWNFPLIHAVSSQDIEVIKLLLENKASVNFENRNKITPLMKATKKADIDVLELLLKAGADINYRNSLGKTVLMYALGSKGKEILNFFIKNGADINAKDNEGKSVLMHTLLDKNTLIAEELIEKGADINARDNQGKTILMYALRNWKRSTFKYILDRIIDINARDNEGKTALMHAVILDELHKLRILLEKGACVGFADKHGETALILASKLKNKYILQELTNSQRVQFENSNNIKILFNDSFQSVKEFIEIQIQLSGEVNVVDRHNCSLLILATIKGSKQLVEILIRKGADVNHRDDFGNTAFSYAVVNDNKEIMELLSKNGAKI